MKSVKVSIYQDCRKPKEDGLYPISLRVYYDALTRYFQIKENGMPIYLGIEDFDNAYNVVKPKPRYQNKYDILQAHLSNAKAIINSLKAFSFEGFEKKLYAGGAAIDVIRYYEDYIAKLDRGNQINTRDNYKLSLRSLLLFELHRCGKKVELNGVIKNDEKLAMLKSAVKRLEFSRVTPDYLQQYEDFMIHEVGRSRTTVGIYVRPLRALFNIAREDGDISKDDYPFGKRKYQIPTGKKVKKALDMDALKKLHEAETIPGTRQEKAKDFWFYSYQANGLNVMDVALLKYKDVGDNVITVIREKTKNTTKADPKIIQVPVTEYTLKMFEKYGNSDKSPSSYVFDILKPGMSAEEIVRTVKAFSRFINQHIKSLASSVGITTDISNQWGRHSFATNAVRKGKSLAYIQESLGHQTITTTMNYWAGFESNEKKTLNEDLMNFE